MKAYLIPYSYICETIHTAKVKHQSRCERLARKTRWCIHWEWRAKNSFPVVDSISTKHHKWSDEKRVRLWPIYWKKATIYTEQRVEWAIKTFQPCKAPKVKEGFRITKNPEKISKKRLLHSEEFMQKSEDLLICWIPKFF